MQPVVLISDDGRSAMGRFRLFQPRTGKTVGKAGDFFGASFWGGMYHDQYVLEDGIWRIWELTLDEPYINPVAWKDGVWAKSKDPLPRRRPRAFSGGNFPPDIPLTSLGKREEHFRGGTGETEEWPSILPMWFQYTNPVSGRVPELFQGPACPARCAPSCGSKPTAIRSRRTRRKRTGRPDVHRGRGCQVKDMEFRIRGVGNVTLEELEARFLAYMNAGAPEPVLEGTAEEQNAILELVARRGDSQMRALVDFYLKDLTRASPLPRPFGPPRDWRCKTHRQSLKEPISRAADSSGSSTPTIRKCRCRC